MREMSQSSTSAKRHLMSSSLPSIARAAACSAVASFNTARFPHNYVGSTFMPLPGIHEMAAKLRERREKQGAEQARNDTSAAHDITKKAVADVDTAARQSASGAIGVGTNAPRTAAAPDAAAAAAAAEDISNDHASRKLAGSKSKSGAVDGAGDGSASKDAQDDPQKAVAAAATAGSPKSPPSSVHATGPKMNPQASAAPSLPPFSKGAASFTGATAAQTQQAGGDTSAAGPEQGTQIDGVGFEGAPPNSSSSCKCCMM